MVMNLNRRLIRFMRFSEKALLTISGILFSIAGTLLVWVILRWLGW